MYSRPVYCSMSSSNYCFLTCIQISQEADQVVWYSHLFKNFPVCCDPYSQRLWHSQKRSRCFTGTLLLFWCSNGCWNLISGSSAFSKSSLNIWKLMVPLLLKPRLENFEHYFARVWDEWNCAVVWAFFGTAFLWVECKMTFLSPVATCWVFQICWHTECSPFTASFFRIWNSSTGMPSPPLALFVVMLPKAHLTSYSRISGSRSVNTPPWLSGLWRSFLYSFSVYYCHLFLISSASVRSIPFLSFIVPIFAWNVPLVSLIFLNRFLVFSILLFFSISLHWLLRKAFLSLLAILWNSAFKWVYLSFFFFFAFHISSIHSYL